MWTCDLISKQTCPCQPESCRRCASCTPKQAFLRPGAGEPAGLPAPVRRGVCISASCLPAARHRCCTTDVTNLLSLCAWLLDYFWMGERAGAGPLAPWCHSCKPGGRWMGLLLFLALSFAKPPKGWTPHSWLSWSRSLSNWQRWMCKDCSFPPLWGCLQTINKNVLWKQQRSRSGDDAISSAMEITYSLSLSDLMSWYFVWADEMQHVANVFVSQFTSNVDICSCVFPSCWELN